MQVLICVCVYIRALTCVCALACCVCVPLRALCVCVCQSMENEMTLEERRSKKHQYWIEIDGKPWFQFEVIDGSYNQDLAGEEDAVLPRTPAPGRRMSLKPAVPTPEPAAGVCWIMCVCCLSVCAWLRCAVRC